MKQIKIQEKQYKPENKIPSIKLKKIIQIIFFIDPTGIQIISNVEFLRQ